MVIARSADTTVQGPGQTREVESREWWKLNPVFPFETTNVPNRVRTFRLVCSMYSSTSVSVVGNALYSTAVDLPKFASRPLHREKIHFSSSWLSFRFIIHQL
jgi:hypothetical protein